MVRWDVGLVMPPLPRIRLSDPSSGGSDQPSRLAPSSSYVPLLPILLTARRHTRSRDPKASIGPITSDEPWPESGLTGPGLACRAYRRPPRSPWPSPTTGPITPADAGCGPGGVSFPRPHAGWASQEPGRVTGRGGSPGVGADQPTRATSRVRSSSGGWPPVKALTASMTARTIPGASRSQRPSTSSSRVVPNWAPRGSMASVMPSV